MANHVKVPVSLEDGNMTTRKVNTFKMGGKYGLTQIPVQRTEVTCRCGAKTVITSDLGDPCSGGCGQWFNFGGQPIRPPEEWGEETGERFGRNGEYLGGGDD